MAHVADFERRKSEERERVSAGQGGRGGGPGRGERGRDGGSRGSGREGSTGAGNKPMKPTAFHANALKSSGAVIAAVLNYIDKVCWLVSSPRLRTPVWLTLAASTRHKVYSLVLKKNNLSSLSTSLLPTHGISYTSLHIY